MLCCFWSYFNDVCASWVFLPSEHESCVPTGDVAMSRFIYVCHAVHLVTTLFPLPSLLSWNWLSATCATGMCLLDSHEQSTDVVNRNEFLATSITHTHTHMDRQTPIAPPHIYLQWLAELVGAHARTCSLAQGLRHLSDRERLSLCSHQPRSEEHTITDLTELGGRCSAGYKV